MSDPELQAEIERLKAELEAERKAKATGTIPKVLYLNRERKQTYLSGRPQKESDPDVDQWLDDIETYIKTLDSEDRKKEYITHAHHLTGKARDEIRFRPVSDRNDSNKIISILRSTFGKRESTVRLQQELFVRKQHSDESLYDYSLELLKMAYAIEKKDADAFQDKDNLLTEIFIEGIKDSSIRGELYHIRNDDPDISFFEFRKVCEWFDKGTSFSKTSVKTAKSCESSAELVQSESASALPQKEENSLSELLRLVKVQTRKLEEQQKLQQEQQKKIDNLSNHLFQRRPFKARSYSYYGRTQEQMAESRLKTEDYNRFSCFTCGGRSHKAVQCPSRGHKAVQCPSKVGYDRSEMKGRGRGQSYTKPSQGWGQAKYSYPRRNSITRDVDADAQKSNRLQHSRESLCVWGKHRLEANPD